ncbi:MAG: energy transducer TonB [Verrucomicrobiota bacterium]
MHKTYTPPPRITGARAIPIICGLGFGLLLFIMIPLTTMITAKGKKEEIELTKVATEELPPQEELKPPEPPPPQEKVDEPVAPDIAPVAAQPISIEQLTADVAVGGGGFMAGLVAPVQSTESIKEVVKEMVFSMEDLDQKPVAVAQIQPTHPRELVKARVEGNVTLLFVVDEQGRVEDPRVENSSRPEFERPALEAVRKWKFKPGTKEGAPVKTYIRQPIQFSIRNS